MSIKVDHILKQYGTQKAVDHISFEVAPGEIVGFLGPNGAGKSTTMKMITGFLRPDEGSIEVCGIPVEGEAIATKKKIGYLPELNPLYHEMYVREYLGMMAGLHKIASPAERIEAVINLTGLTPEAHKEIGQLSKGYKQRVGLAAALLHDPEVLILDEPTTGLDPNQIVEIREVIRSLGKNKTILFSTHILQEVEALCERVIVVNKGRIVADDSIGNLKNSKPPPAFGLDSGKTSPKTPFLPLQVSWVWCNSAPWNGSLKPLIRTPWAKNLWVSLCNII